MRWIDLLRYAASLAVLATFCTSRMVPLRLVAIGSNVLFGLFGALAYVYPVLFLHTILLPINVFRLLQVRRFAHHGRITGGSSLTQPAQATRSAERETHTNAVSN